MHPPTHGLDRLQRIAMSLMAALVLVTFFGTNLQAVLWQSSEWLVSTVLPATVVDLTNREREEAAAAPLRRNATLDAAATLKAKHMAENEYFAHYAPDGTSPWYWFDEAGYVYAHAGENLAIHFTDSAEVVEAWMQSPTHRANIVDAKYVEIGVGTAKGKFDGYDTVYVVQLFGAPAVTPLASAANPAPATPTPAPTPTPTPAPVPVSAPAESVGLNETPQSNTLVGETALTPVLPVEPPTAPAAVPAELVPEPDPVPTAPVPNPVSSPSPEPTSKQATALVDVSEPVLESVSRNESLAVAQPTARDIVVVQTPLISTSSGLAVAQITTPNDGHAGATVASLATRPHLLLEIIYVTLAIVVIVLLSLSVVLEARRFHYRQVAYGILLLFGMGGLWFMHALLTTGAVIV